MSFSTPLRTGDVAVPLSGGRGVRKFTAVKDTLLKYQKQKVLRYPGLRNMTHQQLENVLLTFRQHTQDVYGAQASNRQCVKIPAALFNDFRAGGAVACILRCCLHWKTEMGWEDFEHLLQPTKRDPTLRQQQLQLMKFVSKELREAGLWVPPQVFVHDQIPSDRADRLTETLIALGGEIVEDPMEATHVVVCDLPENTPEAVAKTEATKRKEQQRPKRRGRKSAAESSDSDPETGPVEYLRTVCLDGDKALVHYWYHPDSYDTWISADNINAPDGKVETSMSLEEWKNTQHIDPNHSQRLWVVQERWLRDSQHFNEWMNPEDYTLDEEEDWKTLGLDPAVFQRHPLVRRRRRAFLDEGNPIVNVQFVLDGAPAFSRRVDISASVFDAMKSGSRVVMANGVSYPPREPSSLYPEVTPARLGFETEQRAKSSRRVIAIPTTATLANINSLPAEPVLDIPLPAVQKKPLSFPVIIPAYSRWFRMDSVHPIEKRTFFQHPEALDPETGLMRDDWRRVYVEIRNRIVNLSRADPRRFLTLEACQTHIKGDVILIRDIHSFLEYWGLINYQVSAGILGSRQVGSWLKSQPGSAEEGKEVLDQTPLQELYRSDGPEQKAKREQILGGFMEYAGTSEFPRRNENPFESLVCRSCQVSCSDFHYISRTQPDYVLCAHCFRNGRFEEHLEQRDFFRVSAVEDERPAPVGTTRHPESWTGAETIRLLEALDMYQDDWEAVANHVGTQTKESCILKFVQMPIQSALHPTEAMSTLRRNKSLQDNPYQFGTAMDGTGGILPFSDAANPIMAQIAFMAATVSPNVAAAAAKATVQTLSQRLAKDWHDFQLQHAIKVQTSLGPGVVYPPIPTILRLQTDPDKMTDDGDLDSSSSSSSGGRLTGKRRRRRQSSSFSPGSPQQSKRLKKSTGPEAFLQAAGELDTPLHHTHSSPQVPMGLDPNLVIPLEQCARTDGMVEVHFSFGRGYLPLKELKELPAETRIEAPLPHLLGGIRDVETVADTCLSAGAAKAADLARAEERKLLRLMGELVECQMQKITAKLDHLDELQGWMQRERTQLDARVMEFHEKRVQSAAALRDMQRKFADFQAGKVEPSPSPPPPQQQQQQQQQAPTPQQVTLQLPHRHPPPPPQ